MYRLKKDLPFAKKGDEVLLEHEGWHVYPLRIWIGESGAEMSKWIEEVEDPEELTGTLILIKREIESAFTIPIYLDKAKQSLYDEIKKILDKAKE